MPGHGPVFVLGRSLPDVHDVPQPALAIVGGAPARAAGGIPATQIPRQLLAQRPTALPEQRHVDRLVAHLHLLPVAVTRCAATRRPAAGTTESPVWLPPPPAARLCRPTSRSSAAAPATQARSSAVPARYRRAPPLRATSRHTVEAARPIPTAITRTDKPSARPREISSRSANDSCRTDWHRARSGRRRNGSV